MTQRAQSHHSVPRAYFRPWSRDGKSVSAYRLLVPAEKYPVWEQRSIRSLTAYADLYTSVVGGEDSDEFERWLNREVETPAAPALEKVYADAKLNRKDWDALAVYAAALDLRTPASYIEIQQRWEQQLPQVMSEVLGGLKQTLESAAKRKRRLPKQTPSKEHRFPLRVRIEEDPGTDSMVVKTEITTGRELWIHSIRSLILSMASTLKSHRWLILHPSNGCEWFTSDHPLVRLNYYGDGQYDFAGGWGRANGEILLALSPRHLMYTKVGDTSLQSGTLTSDLTLALQRFIAQRAHRWIVATGQPRRATWFRPRVVNREAFTEEQRQWDNWHKNQRDAETSA